MGSHLKDADFSLITSVDLKVSHPLSILADQIASMKTAGCQKHGDA
jgi:hypothetical protein